LKVVAVASIGETSGARATTDTAGPRMIRRRHSVMLGLLLASVAGGGGERAEAACTPATSSVTPLTNTTVTCTGTTLNQNQNGIVFAGYGVPEDKGITINVGSITDSTASVTGTDIGIQTGNASFGIGPDTVNNFGTISATGLAGRGIVGEVGIVNNKFGATITASGGFGILILSEGVVITPGESQVTAPVSIFKTAP
jgi:hypothetical protein